MKYFLDTEFIEGTQKTLFGHTKPTIDLISIGIVCEHNNREYYAISKDFNLKEAWNRFDLKLHSGDRRNICDGTYKEYWIRENVLKPIWNELVALEVKSIPPLPYQSTFTYKEMKRLLSKYGKTNEQIAEEIKDFVSFNDTYGHEDSLIIESHTSEYRRTYEGRMEILKRKNMLPEFYAYYADYDWVAFCWLFGKMIDLPKGFPMYCRDLKQELDRLQETKFGIMLFNGNFVNNIKELPKYPKQENEHNALDDARWNMKLYNFLNLINQ